MRSAIPANRSISFAWSAKPISPLLKSLTPQKWKHYGMHSERGQETIDQIVRMYAGHDINHLRQIERILSAEAK